MKRRTMILRIQAIAILLIAAGAAIAYWRLEPETPNKALLVACCAVVLIVNIILSMIFVYKNVRR